MFDITNLDLGRAFWALALSVALWLVVQTEVNPERADTFYIDIEPRNVPTGLIVTNEATWPQVQVRLSAPRDVFAQLRAGQLRAYVDLGRVGPGETRVPVVVPAPDPLVRVGEPNPRTVVVRLEEVARKTVPVRARLEGNSPFGYRPGRPSLSPETLTVTGPASFVRRVDAAQVEVRLDAVTTDIDARLPPVLVDAEGERVPANVPGVDLQPNTVRVQLSISQQVSYKEVGVHPLLEGAVPSGYWVQRIAVDPAVVTLIGEPQTLSGLEAVQTEPVDLTGATADVTRQVALQVPEGTTLARAEPVVVTVQVAPLTLQQTLRLPVVIQNVGAELFVASDVPIVEVVASGPADAGLSPAQVQASVDATDLAAGVHQLPVRVQLPDRYRLDDVRPGTVSVTLQAASTVAVPAPPAPPNEPPPSPEPTATPTPVPTEAPVAVFTPTAAPTTTATRTATAAATPTRTPAGGAARVGTPGPQADGTVGRR